MKDVRTVVQVSIPAKGRAYTIAIENGLLPALGKHLKEHLGESSTLPAVLLISDQTVWRLYGEIVQQALENEGFPMSRHLIADGETSKSLSQAEQIYATALDTGLGRKDVLLALGGGVVGDLAGFCAATYYRGTRFVQVPTTLLAQVDSSVGGKVAVNFKTVKNGIGTFYQPEAVFIDPEVLSTLPNRELKAGLAEGVKYGLMAETVTGETTFLDFLTAHAPDLSSAWGTLIERCCRIKAAVVQQDETEQSGVRFYLNLGHTFAHAYEAATHYTQILHGEAVAMGMLKACRLAERLDIFPATETDRFVALATQLDLPLDPPGHLDPHHLLTLMRQDKKAQGGRLRFVLPTERLGKVVIRDDVPDEAVLAVLSDGMS